MRTSLPSLVILLCILIQQLGHSQQQDTVFIRYDRNIFDGTFQYETDTIVQNFANQPVPLVGTTILPWTINQQHVKAYGLYLNSVALTNCDKSAQLLESDVICVVAVTDAVLEIEVQFTANCCHDFLCDVEIVNDTTLNLIRHDYGYSYCGCECCFGLTYQFSRLPSERFDTITNITLNGRAKTPK